VIELLKGEHMSKDDVAKEIEEIFENLHPGFSVIFADEWDDALSEEHEDEILESLQTMNKRLSSKWLGWFWKWYYRPRRLDG
jgi:hypothetical protein